MVNNPNHCQNIYFPRSLKDSGRAYYILSHQILVISYSIIEQNVFYYSIDLWEYAYQLLDKFSYKCLNYAL